jgi:hypothetical protein
MHETACTLVNTEKDWQETEALCSLLLQVHLSVPWAEVSCRAKKKVSYLSVHTSKLAEVLNLAVNFTVVQDLLSVLNVFYEFLALLPCFLSSSFWVVCLDIFLFFTLLFLTAVLAVILTVIIHIVGVPCTVTLP